MYSQPDTYSWFCICRWNSRDMFWGEIRDSFTRAISMFGLQVSGFRFQVLGAGRGDSVLGENRSKLSDLHTNRSDYKAILDSSDSLLLLLTSPLTCFSSSSCLVGCWLGSEVPGVAWVKQRIIPRFHRMEICPNGATHPAWVCRACRCWNSWKFVWTHGSFLCFYLLLFGVLMRVVERVHSYGLNCVHSCIGGGGEL